MCSTRRTTLLLPSFRRKPEPSAFDQRIAVEAKTVREERKEREGNQKRDFLFASFAFFADKSLFGYAVKKLDSRLRGNEGVKEHGETCRVVGPGSRVPAPSSNGQNDELWSAATTAGVTGALEP